MEIINLSPPSPQLRTIELVTDELEIGSKRRLQVLEFSVHEEFFENVCLLFFFSQTFLKEYEEFVKQKLRQMVVLFTKTKYDANLSF